MKKALLFTFFSLAIVLVASANSSAQTSVTGEWDGAFETPGGARPFKLVLKVDGEKLTGTAKRASGDVPITGTVKGGNITFSYTISYNGNDLTMSFSGKISGDTMSGSVSFGSAEETWSAKRAPAEKPKTD
ncbi:MAG: hypothetical protein IPO41_01555 [Acidobacteria bacterium]|nr:hypothetical protein [Acidobacteriota bacterium]